jgi:hypothetical protein
VQFDHEFEVIYPTTGTIDVLGIGGNALNLPATGTRPSAPVAGALRWSTTLGVQETYNGSAWFSHLPILSQAASTVFIAPAGAAGLPTFRLMGIGELSDVAVTSPATNQTLTFNGTNWVNSSVAGANASGIIGVGASGGGTAWTLVSGSRYTANFVHGLGTTNVVITVFDTSNNAVVIPDSIVTTDANTVTVVVVGNTKSLKVVVIANGQSIVAGGSTPSSVVTAYQGVTVSAAATKLNFIGSTVVIDAGGGTTNVSIGARFTNYANSFDTPNNADWTVNAFAPTITDPVNAALNVRSFSNTTETGVGFTCTVPAGATQATFRFRGRAASAIAGAANVVGLRVYYRAIPSNAAVSAWSGALDLNNLAIPASNVFFQNFAQSATIAAAGLTAGTTYQFELTRKVAPAGGTQLAAAFLLAEVTFEFA